MMKYLDYLNQQESPQDKIPRADSRDTAPLFFHHPIKELLQRA